MITEHLSDTQLQQLALDEGVADAASLQHIALCEECKTKLLDFHSMFAEIKILPKPVAGYNLSALVLARLPQPAIKDRQDSFIYSLVFAVFGSMALPVYFFWDYFIKITDGIAPLVLWFTLILAVVILIAGIVTLSKDYKKKIATIRLHTGLM